ncbi:MAG: DUF4351 domain-containing protein [Acaryochloris sp. RU_4_1]|nr:DUF4351 domain-containing protein [Acaryochloris sp. RU_4_1]NJR56714.1 DUF4351 domain-containing protein [Acaryochloris sp. CRU_2_0]
MRESVIYQEILEEGLQKGRLEGRQEGLRAGERLLVLRLLTRRLGDIPQEVRSQIEMLSVEQLEALGEALLDFMEMADLERWITGATDGGSGSPLDLPSAKKSIARVL